MLFRSTNPEAAKWAAQDWVWRWCGKLQHCTAVQYRMSRQKEQEPYLPLRCPCKAEIKVIGRENEMTRAGGIGKQKPPVKEKCTSSLNVTLANYRRLPFAVCCSRSYIVYQTVKKLHFCLIACVGATIGRPSTYRGNTFSGTVFIQGKRARASNARPYKSFSTV